MKPSNAEAPLVAVAFLMLLFPAAYGWGIDGHRAVCRIAQTRFSKASGNAVRKLLPAGAENDLESLCSWADHVKRHYHWSSALHYIDTSDYLCNYKYNRDCRDERGEIGKCVSGAIRNYTEQLLSYNNEASETSYNLTEALLFLSHFMGDIHQPLHVGFRSDRGGNTIHVEWYTRRQVLHHVWDDDIINTESERFHDSNVDDLIRSIEQNITTEWADLVESWEICSAAETACPDVYAEESIRAACDWAYKGAPEESTLGDEYFQSRLPVVNMRLAQGGVRLAATLNRVFQ